MNSKKSRGAVVYADTSAAAIILDGDEYWNKCWRHAASFLCSPPLREDELRSKKMHVQFQVVNEKVVLFPVGLFTTANTYV